MKPRLIRLIVLASLLVLPFAAYPSPVIACSCVSLAVQEQFAAADIVFQGRVVAVEIMPYWHVYLPWNWDTHGRTEARLKVETMWKGPARVEYAIVDHLAWTSCSVALNDGVDYLVYGRRDGDATLSVSRCDGTESVDRSSFTAKTLAALGPGTPIASAVLTSAPAPNRAGNDLVLVLVLGGLGLAAVGGAWRWRRETGAGGSRSRP